jgi:hypothetical protein
MAEKKNKYRKSSNPNSADLSFTLRDKLDGVSVDPVCIACGKPIKPQDQANGYMHWSPYKPWRQGPLSPSLNEGCEKDANTELQVYLADGTLVPLDADGQEIVTSQQQADAA